MVGVQFTWRGLTSHILTTSPWPADPRSEELALEASSLMQDDGVVNKCSSCFDVGLLKKCVRPGCPYVLCFQKSNMQPCIRDLSPGDFWCPPCWNRRGSGPLPVSQFPK
jgi:hypothetical protein